jgi:hypothetical protein
MGGEKMKRTILGLFVFCTFSYTLQITKVQAAGGYLIKVIESLSAGTDAQMICKEQQDSSSADAFNVYSANGRMCSVPLAGAFAEVVCPGVDADYNSSTCHQISMAILHTQDPKMALQEQIGKLPHKSKEGICTKATSVNPVFAQTIKEVCSQSSETPKVGAKEAPKSTEKAYMAKVTKYEEAEGALVEITDVNQIKGGNPAFKGKPAYLHSDRIKQMTGAPLKVGSVIKFDVLNPEAHPNPLKKDAFFILSTPVQ